MLAVLERPSLATDTEPMRVVRAGDAEKCSVADCTNTAHDCCWIVTCRKPLCIQHCTVKDVLGEGWIVCPEHKGGVS